MSALNHRDPITRVYKQVRDLIVYGLLTTGAFIGLLVFAIWWGM